ncbi:MAG: ABC transporter ATP-binding protein [Eubacterium sp.]|nr:ABC transporter ATP-binding protein [Eubacterium sp.]
MGSQLLSIENLQAWYSLKQPVLSGLSVGIMDHAVTGLIGLNGAGKTTFLKILSGLLDHFRADEILFDGCPVSFRKPEFKLCRYTVFAEDDSFGYFTFWEYLKYVCMAYGKKMPDVSGLIRGFHFEGHTDMLLKELSTGNKKKVFLITAFALKPRLLLLDEPVNGLDFESTEFLYQLIAGYKEYGAVLFSSHILESITLTADRVLVLENGKIRQDFGSGEIDAAQIREALHEERN